MAYAVNNTDAVSARLSNTDRYHLARLVEQIEIAFPYTISTNLHIFPFYAGASRLPPRVLASGPRSCGGNNYRESPVIPAK